MTVVTLPDVEKWRVLLGRIWCRPAGGRSTRSDFLQLRPNVAEVRLELSHRRIHGRPPGCEILDDWLKGNERRLHLGDHWLNLLDRRCHPVQRLLDREEILGDAAPLLRGFLQLLLDIDPRHDLFQTASFRRQIGPRKKKCVVDLKAPIPNDPDLGVG